MAYRLGTKQVLDTEEFASVAYGITSPTRRGDVMFQQTFTSFDAAKSNLRNLLLTRKGERVMQPEFGSGLFSVLFEPMDDNEFEQTLVDTITNSVNFWLPYISIQEINVEMSNEMKDQNKATLEVKFTVGESIDLQSITIEVEG